MKKLFIIFTIFTLLVSGCINTKTVYYSKESNQTITLFDDHTFRTETPNKILSGTYRIDGDYLYFTFPTFGTSIKRKITDNAIIDERDGERWERI